MLEPGKAGITLARQRSRIALLHRIAACISHSLPGQGRIAIPAPAAGHPGGGAGQQVELKLPIGTWTMCNRAREMLQLFALIFRQVTLPRLRILAQQDKQQRHHERLFIVVAQRTFRGKAPDDTLCPSIATDSNRDVSTGGTCDQRLPLDTVNCNM